MISKVITGKTFYGTCRYICMDRKRALILEAEGVRGHDYKLMANDFTNQRNLRTSLKNVVFHGILSFYPGEKISDQKMIEIAKEYLHELGIINTQYAITKHTDKSHCHLHLIANLVNNSGQTIKDSWIGLKGKKVAQKLTLKYGLTKAPTKNLALTNLEHLNEKEATRYVIYQAISESLPHSKNLNELRYLLEKRGVETFYKYKGQTNELQGISFKIGEFKYKGSSIDRNFSLKNLERVIEANQQQIVPHLKNIDNKKLLHREEKISLFDTKSEAIKVIMDIVKPDQNLEQIPAELKKKRKKKSLGL